MSKFYRLFGAEMSPYSVKVRSYCRYKGIPHQWISRDNHSEAEYKAHAKLPIIPLLVDEQGQSMQDSTPIIESLEAGYNHDSIHPKDEVCGFISQMLEEFGDEWGNKWMFHYRWAREVDQLSCSKRLALMMQPSLDEKGQTDLAENIAKRMVNRVYFVGSNDNNADQIESSFTDALELLDQHLATRPYLFGARPSFGDFGLWAQLYCAWTDPTCGALMDARAQHVVAWVQKMLWPRQEGEFETWDTLEPTLKPFLTQQLGGLFLPWSAANSKALTEGLEEFEVNLLGCEWRQQPQKYHAKSLVKLQHKYREIEDKDDLNCVLESSHCLAYLLP